MVSAMKPIIENTEKDRSTKSSLDNGFSGESAEHGLVDKSFIDGLIGDEPYFTHFFYIRLRGVNSFKKHQ